MFAILFQTTANTDAREPKTFVDGVQKLVAFVDVALQIVITSYSAAL